MSPIMNKKRPQDKKKQWAELATAEMLIVFYNAIHKRIKVLYIDNLLPSRFTDNPQLIDAFVES